MLDVSKAIQAKSDQLNADDLLGGSKVIRIRDVHMNESAEQKLSIFYDGDDNRPWKPCKTAARCLATIWGQDALKWIGMHVEVYNDPHVSWGGVAVGGIRVGAMEGLEKPVTINLTKSRGKKAGVIIKPLNIEARKEPEERPQYAAIAQAVITAYEVAETIDELRDAHTANVDAIKLLKAEPTLLQAVNEARNKRKAELDAEGRANGA